MSQKEIEFCFMEVSSHGIDQDRINGLKFYCGVFLQILPGTTWTITNPSLLIGILKRGFLII